MVRIGLVVLEAPEPQSVQCHRKLESGGSFITDIALLAFLLFSVHNLFSHYILYYAEEYKMLLTQRTYGFAHFLQEIDRFSVLYDASALFI
jgi:hypothetical protein